MAAHLTVDNSAPSGVSHYSQPELPEH